MIGEEKNERREDPKAYPRRPIYLARIIPFSRTPTFTTVGLRGSAKHRPPAMCLTLSVMESEGIFLISLTRAATWKILHASAIDSSKATYITRVACPRRRAHSSPRTRDDRTLPRDDLPRVPRCQRVVARWRVATPTPVGFRDGRAPPPGGSPPTRPRAPSSRLFDDDAPPRTLDVDERRAALVARANALRAKAIKVNLAALGVPSSQFFEKSELVDAIVDVWSSRLAASVTVPLRQIIGMPGNPRAGYVVVTLDVGSAGFVDFLIDSGATAAPISRASRDARPSATDGAAIRGWVRWGRPCDRR